jgi:hypothetical protein
MKGEQNKQQKKEIEEGNNKMGMKERNDKRDERKIE